VSKAQLRRRGVMVIIGGESMAARCRGEPRIRMIATMPDTLPNGVLGIAAGCWRIDVGTHSVLYEAF